MSTKNEDGIFELNSENNYTIRVKSTGKQIVDVLISFVDLSPFQSSELLKTLIETNKLNQISIGLKNLENILPKNLKKYFFISCFMGFFRNEIIFFDQKLQQLEIDLCKKINHSVQRNEVQPFTIILQKKQKFDSKEKKQQKINFLDYGKLFLTCNWKI